MTSSSTKRFPRVAAALTAAVLSGTLALAGCGGEPDKPAASPSPSPVPAPTVKSAAKLVHVQGKFPRSRHQAVATNVAKVVDRWLQAAYVGGDYPRATSTFTAKSFPGFSKGTIAQAGKQMSLMSNATIAPDIDGVEVVSSDVHVDLLANNNYPVGAVARVRLVYDTTGDLESRQTVRGSLDMVPTETSWAVFGFNITREEKPATAPSASPSPSGDKS
ncbi:hypothetical protein NBCG_04326 [Nocardioidaceae bacterium Broad-1]|uniref:hypothetical protein n=1 Tax=Nocardioides luteus TaxID=1844 RepID=UPI00020292A5|nr:hypothetical protein [Nocardioides luteus]EGD41329.1 hypothetical protein NBCG_04326 [Nocardioidaceae bacterium Broad-1]MBG6095098.1 hypothetical protein [Nocardioides luteus]